MVRKKQAAPRRDVRATEGYVEKTQSPPQPAIQQGKKRGKRPGQQAQQSQVDCLSNEHLLGLLEVLFTSPAPPPRDEATIRVQHVPGFISIGFDQVQVLLAVPNARTALALVRLLSQKRMALCMRPADAQLEQILEQDAEVIVEPSAAAQDGIPSSAFSAGDGGLDAGAKHTSQHPFLLNSYSLFRGPKGAAYPAHMPGEVVQRWLAGHSAPTPNGHDAAVSSPRSAIKQLEPSTSTAAVLRQLRSADMCAPLPLASQPERVQLRAQSEGWVKHGAICGAAGPWGTPGGAQDSKVWTPLRVLSSRLSAMLGTPLLDCAEAADVTGPGAMTAADEGEDAVGEQEDEHDGSTHMQPPPASQPRPLRPGPEDSVWSLQLGLSRAALPRGQQPSTAAVGAEGASGSDGQPDAEEESRRPWQSDLLMVLRWLLPHVAAAIPDAGAGSEDAWAEVPGTLEAAAAQLEVVALDGEQGGAEEGEAGKPDGHGRSSAAAAAAAAAIARAEGRLPQHNTTTAAEGVTHTPTSNGALTPAAGALQVTVSEAMAACSTEQVTSTWVPAVGGGIAGELAAAPGPSAGPTEQSKEPPGFDAARLYAAVKPRGDEPAFYADPPELRPTLRPYQRRGVAWMLRRERWGTSPVPNGQTGPPAVGAAAAPATAAGAGADMQVPVSGLPIQLHPLWRRVATLPSAQQEQSVHEPVVFYLNPFTGLLRTVAPLVGSDYGVDGVRGGVLADEMGLGKTVELLATILTNRFIPDPSAPGQAGPSNGRQIDEEAQERIDCVCGFQSWDVDDDDEYKGLWVCCDQCLAWMHGACVGLKKAPPKSAPFVCTSCMRQAASALITEACGATLVVCPGAILAQWWDEIHKHIKPGTMRVVVYNGQMQAGTSAAAVASQSWAAPEQSGSGQGRASYLGQVVQVVSARDLAAADIVLTTYDVLKRDVARQPDLEVETKALRRKKKYEVVPTPLTRLCWWRVVLDEAQMVESSTAKAAEMALKLDTVHRWCVTGTPISARGLEDVCGLCTFLKPAPWASRLWWHRVVQRPAEMGCQLGWQRLMRLMWPAQGGLMWRTSKRDVAAELGIPEQHAHMTMLHLSAIERHFYTRQHRDVSRKVQDVLPPDLLAEAAAAPMSALGSPHRHGRHGAHPDDARALATDRPLTQREAKRLMPPLLKLRQAACHPQVGTGGIRALTAQRAPMTMDEILGVLVSKAKTEAEEAQRALIAALNGLAGLMLLEGGHTPAACARAVETYRLALNTMEVHKKDINTDPLQRLHTLHNLAALLQTPPSGPPALNGDSATFNGYPHLPGVLCTLRDETLMSEAAGLRSKYLEQRVVRLAAHQADYDKALRQASPFSAREGWFIAALSKLSEGGRDSEVVEAVKRKLMEKDQYRQNVAVNASSIAHRFRDLNGLKMLLVDSLEKIETSRAQAMGKMDELIAACRDPGLPFVEQAGQCGRCRAELGCHGRKCEHCSLDELLLGWEVNLFALYTRAMAAGGKVSAKEAAKRAHENLLRHMWAADAATALAGAGVSSGAGAAAALPGQEGGRRDETVSDSQIMWLPSEAEQVLKEVLHQLRTLARHVGRHGPDAPSRITDGLEEVLQAADSHLERLEGQRKLFAQLRALSLAQRQLLYAHDELAMAVTRLRLRLDGEAELVDKVGRDAAMDLTAVHPAELPIRNVELTNDKALAERDLQRKLGALRYLHHLVARKQAQARTEAGATPTADTHAGAGVPAVPAPQQLDTDQGLSGQGAAGDVAAGRAAAGAVAGEEGVDEKCPICHDPIGAQCVMVPCGHVWCCNCNDMLLKSVRQHQFQPGSAGERRINCPTCREPHPVSDITFVDGGGDDGDNTDGDRWVGEADIRVRGSYGSKMEAVVRRLLAILTADERAKVVVFSSWGDVLDLLAHALDTNSVPHAWAKARRSFQDALHAFKHGTEAVAGEAGPGVQDEGVMDVDMHAVEEERLNAAYEETKLDDQLIIDSEDQDQIPAHAAHGLHGLPAPMEVGAAVKQEVAQGGKPSALSPVHQPGSSAAEAGAAGKREVSELAAADEPPSKRLRKAPVPRSHNRRGHRFGGGDKAGAPRAHGPISSSARGPPRVLLLLVSQGGAGLNITEAQHVVLVEPLLEPAVEQQAIGRVHRIGQTQETHVHRFVVGQTVEENVASLSAARSAGMDMAAATAQHAGGSGGSRDMLTVRDVAVLLRASWDPTGGVNLLGGAGPRGQRNAMAQQEQPRQRPPRVPRQPRARVRSDPALLQSQEEGVDVELGRGRRLRNRQRQEQRSEQQRVGVGGAGEGGAGEAHDEGEADEESDGWEDLS